MVKNANTEISCYDPPPNFKSDEAAEDLTQYGSNFYTFPPIYKGNFSPLLLFEIKNFFFTITIAAPYCV